MSLQRIVHCADTHGTNACYQAVTRMGNRHSLLLDAGDAIQGSNTAFRWNEPNLSSMTELGFHAMTMGNRELHYLPLIMERRASQRGFPLLAANLVELWGRPASWQEGVSLDFDGFRVGVFGMTVVQYPVGSLYEKLFGLRFLPPETLIEYLVEKYQKDHDLVIFLSHLGVDQDRRLARQLERRPELRCDFILGGHTHLIWAQPEVYGHTRVSHVGSHSRGLGVWDRKDSEWAFRWEPVVHQ